MRRAIRAFFSLKFAIIAMLFFACCCALATIVEAIYGTSVAFVLIYSSIWFSALQGLIGLNLAYNIFNFGLNSLKKLPSFTFHVGFLLILTGAAITHFLGFEGIIHLKNGEFGDQIQTSRSFLALNDGLNSQKHPVKEHNQGEFDVVLETGGSLAKLRFQNYQKPSEQNGGKEVFKGILSFNGESKNVEIYLDGRQNRERVGGKDFWIEVGYEMAQLPFGVRLREFKLTRYPGSSSPMRYSSDIEIIGAGGEFGYEIYANHVLDHGGYRIFQLSYDADESGSVLLFSKDPGRIWTYFGYGTLIFGMIFNIFNPHSRFRKIAKLLGQARIHALLLIALAYPLKADLSSLLTQSADGRVRPLDTTAREILQKIGKSEHLGGQNAASVVLSMMIESKIWRREKIIRIKNAQIAQIVGVKAGEFAALDDFLDKNSQYKLEKYLDAANMKNPSSRGEFDKDLMKIDEKVNVLYAVFTGEILRIFPAPNGWISLKDGLNLAQTSALIQKYFFEVDKARANDDWSGADAALDEIKNYQRENGVNLPSELQIKTEIFMNKIALFSALAGIYFLIGAWIFALALFKRGKFSLKFALILSIAAFGAHCAGLAGRWYIGEHAPWSNAYESMIYTAWAMSFAGIIFSKKSILALSLSQIMAGVMLFGAFLSALDPQITNLIPVLRSFWLTLHVSVITASYGFLGLCALLGVFILSVMAICKKPSQKMQNLVQEAVYIDEISMILGLCLLTIGNFLGGVWANESWGRYWGWDSKETWALVSILIYASALHASFLPEFSYKYAFATMSVFAYGSILMTYFGVNLYLDGKHSYASAQTDGGAAIFALCAAGMAAILSALAFKSRRIYGRI